jgi:4-amino-4-deoxy-L-arabinose transferase-like glycosyltransferase
VAINAKQSNLALIPVALVAVSWSAWEKRPWLRNIFYALGMFCLIGVIITLFLNPLFWSNPLQAGLAVIRARQVLVTNQVSATSNAIPAQVLNTPI